MIHRPSAIARFLARISCSGRRLLQFVRYLWKALTSLMKALLVLIPFLEDPDDCGDEGPPAPSVTPCFVRVLVVDNAGIPKNNVSVSHGQEISAPPSANVSWSATQLKTPSSGGLGCTSTCLHEVAYWHFFLTDLTDAQIAAVDAWVFEPTSDTVTSTSANGAWSQHRGATEPSTYRFQSTNTCRTVLIKFTLT